MNQYIEYSKEVIDALQNDKPGGGMGGVHRGAEITMDISSDLEEIAVRNVIVVCSGAKSILDLNLTMEYLETKSVPVMGYKTDEICKTAYGFRKYGCPEKYDY